MIGDLIKAKKRLKGLLGDKNYRDLLKWVKNKEKGGITSADVVKQAKEKWRLAVLFPNVSNDKYKKQIGDKMVLLQEALYFLSTRPHTSPNGKFYKIAHVKEPLVDICDYVLNMDGEFPQKKYDEYAKYIGYVVRNPNNEEAVVHKKGESKTLDEKISSVFEVNRLKVIAAALVVALLKIVEKIANKEVERKASAIRVEAITKLESEMKKRREEFDKAETERVVKEEAERKAAEEEARRKAAEEEARRKAAEEEARRKAAEEEARRIAAEEEARRIATERVKAERKARKKESISQLKADHDKIMEKIKNHFGDGSGSNNKDDFRLWNYTDKQLQGLKKRVEGSKLLTNLFYELVYVEFCNECLNVRPDGSLIYGVNLFLDVSGSEFSTTAGFSDFQYFAQFLSNSKLLSSFSATFIDNLQTVWNMIPGDDAGNRMVREWARRGDEEARKRMQADPKIADIPKIGTKTSYRKQEALQILGNTDKSLNKIKNTCGETSKVLVEATQTLMVEPLRKQLKEVKEKQKSTKTIDKSQRYVPYGNKVAGSGGYGAVQVYFDNETQQKVAVKTNRDGTSFNLKVIEAAKSIKSNYVAKIIDLIDVGDGKNNGLVMEYVHGETSFMKAIKRFGDDRKKILEICIQLVDGFRALAYAGFVQWDLDQHSQNILIDRSGNVKIIDYDDAYGKGSSGEKNAVEQVASILAGNSYDLFESFKNKLGVKLRVSTRKDLSAFGSLDWREQPPSFDKLINVLVELTHEV